jgi:hypothetical protein
MWVSIIIALIMAVISYMITPKPKQPQPPATQDLEGPTADAGRPVPVVFGTITMKGVNCMWFGDSYRKQIKVKADT